MTYTDSLEYPIVCTGPAGEGHELRVVGVVRLRDGGPMSYRMGDDLTGRGFEECGPHAHVLCYCFDCGRGAMPTVTHLSTYSIRSLVRHVGWVDLDVLRVVDRAARQRATDRDRTELSA